MKYCIDTSSLINPWHKMYPCDLFPSYWERFELLCDEHEVVAPDVVLKELAVQDGDALYKWCKGKDCFKYPLDSNLQEAVKAVMASCNLVNIRKSRSDADVFVVGLAKLKNLAVISQEESKLGKGGLMKIPDACQHLGIRHMSIVGLIREQGWSF